MKKTGILLLGFVLFASGCKKNADYVVSNPYQKDIKDIALVLSRADVYRYLPDTTSELPVFAVIENGALLPSQQDDLNGDGKWDEMAFLIDLKAGESKKIHFETADTQPSFPVRTNIRFGRMEWPYEEVTGDTRMKTNDTKFTAPVYQMEGPAWENDIIAFRNYYDARNGIDIFGKKTSEMVMDSVGVNGREYHTLQDWGMDILKVGNSLGAGAIALRTGDSLYRMGPCEEGTYRLVTEGPVRAILELDYQNVPAGDRSYHVTHQISIYAGDRFYRSKVWVNPLKGDEELVTGIVNLHDIQADTLMQNGKKIMFTLGNQAFDGEILGMGILIPESQFLKYSEAPDSGADIIKTHLVSLKLNETIPAEYFFLAAWEIQDEKIRDKEYFIDLLKEAADRISTVYGPR